MRVAAASAEKIAKIPRQRCIFAPDCNEMVGRAGFEPATNWLKASCSTD
jgi:hypothetical protein